MVLQTLKTFFLVLPGTMRSPTALPEEILTNFWREKKKEDVISERSRQKGLQYGFEAYI